MSKTSNWRASSSSTSRSVTKRVTGSRLEAIARPWYFFFQTCCSPFVENATRRLLDFTVARRTRASKNIGKERGSPQVKSMSNALGKTGRCLVGVVLFTRLDFSVFAGTLPSIEAATGSPPPPNRDVWVRTVRVNLALRLRNKSGSSIKHRVYGVHILCLFLFLFLFFFLFFFIFTFFRNGQGQPPPPSPPPFPQTGMSVFWQMRIFTDGPLAGRNSIILGRVTVSDTVLQRG